MEFNSAFKGLIPGINSGTHWTVGCLGPSAGLETLGRSVAPKGIWNPVRQPSSLDYTEHSTLSWYQPKSNPIKILDKPWGFQEVEAPRFQDSRHMKVVRLSAVRADHLYPPGNIPGIHLCQRLSRPQGHNAAGMIMSIKNSNDSIGNPRTSSF